MAKFRKKPVIIEAEQYHVGKSPPPRGVCTDEAFFHGGPHVHTMHGGQIVVLKDGDWIIPEPDGEHFYPCDDKVFKATYERID